MDVQIDIPQSPVAVAPGAEERAAIEVRNHSARPVSVRLSVARSRAGAWSHIDPAVVDLDPGGSSAVEVVFRPPANVPPASTLMPFTVHAEDLQFGVPVGRATGLVTVAALDRIAAVLTHDATRGGVIDLALRMDNRGDAALTVRLRPRIDPATWRVDADPAVVDLPGGQAAMARVRIRPRAHVVWQPVSYTASVACLDAAADDAGPPLATATLGGTAGPRIGRKTMVVLVGVVFLIVVAVAATFGGLLPGGDAASPGASPTAAAVRKPYALVGVFPKQDVAARANAEAARDRLTAAGMPVRLVDSAASEAVADGTGGFWVLLHDGFASVDEARAFCDRYRAVAPDCRVVE
ncbi:MAG TPA: SPOR domain-containing protein [Pilimelia sp.]|nr:SPOR domain-containing protein [Pilimelia sp.]